MEPIFSDHARLDDRSLALHRRVAEKLLAEPRLLDKARGNIRRWQDAGSSSAAFDEWLDVLAGPVDDVARFLGEQSERATRLRQSSPFAGVLTEAERLTIYESYSARTYHPGRQPHIR